jgi:hypothetical protein
MDLYDALRLADRRGGRMAVRPYAIGQFGEGWPLEPGQYVATDNGVDFGVYEFAAFNRQYLIRRCGVGDKKYCLDKRDWQPYPPRYKVVFLYQGGRVPQRIRYMDPIRNSPDFLVDFDRFWLSPDKKKKGAWPK